MDRREAGFAGAAGAAGGTRSSIVAAFFFGRRTAGIFLMDRREAGFAGAAGAAGGGACTAWAAGVGGCAITAAAGDGAVALVACAALDGAIAGGAVALAAGTAGLPGAVGGTTAVCITGAAGAGGGVATVACIALAGAAGRGAAAGTTGLLGAGGGITLGASTALAGAVAGGGVNPSAGTVRLPGAVGGGGFTAAAGTAGLPDAVDGAGVTWASTGPFGDRSVGGVDGSGAFWRRFGISTGFSTGGATWALATGFALCAVSWRRRFGWASACCAFAFPGIGSGLFSFCVSSVDDAFPRRGTPRRSNQIHFAAPLPPWVRMRSLSSRRGNSSITHRPDKPASLASVAILIWRQARLGITILGAGINSVNTPYNLASASGIRRSSHSIAISGAAGRNQIICSGLGIELANAAPTCWPACSSVATMLLRSGLRISCDLGIMRGLFASHVKNCPDPLVARGDLPHRVVFGSAAQMRVVARHLRGNVSDLGHHYFDGHVVLNALRDKCMSQIVEAKVLHAGRGFQVLPRRRP